MSVLIRELARTPGRLQSTLRATIAVMVALILAVIVAQPAFIWCPVVAMTESTPGTVHSPSLLLRRLLSSLLCALYGIAVVSIFPQSPLALWIGILAGTWILLYLCHVLPVGASGMRVAIWTIGPMFSVPLSDPAGYEVTALLSWMGVGSGAIIAYACALLVFRGSETHRARFASDRLLEESAARLRAFVAAHESPDEPSEPTGDRLEPASPSVLAHIAVLSDAIATYAVRETMFPELVPLTRIASFSDSVVVAFMTMARSDPNRGDARPVPWQPDRRSSAPTQTTRSPIIPIASDNQQRGRMPRG